MKNYDKTTLASRYDAARKMPQHMMQQWMDALSTHVPVSDVHSIIDAGCGTGRFTAALADRFQAPVTGIDPSETMLAKARANVSRPDVTFIRGTGEEMPVEDESASLVFMSMAYHHLASPARAADEFMRVLRPGGYVCIRSSTRDLLDAVPYLRYFPKALARNRERVPSQQGIIGTVTGAGFGLVAHDIIRQFFAASLPAYYEKIAQRGLSDLDELPDAVFEAGLEKMKADCGTAPADKPVLEGIDLFVFRKGSDASDFGITDLRK